MVLYSKKGLASLISTAKDGKEIKKSIFAAKRDPCPLVVVVVVVKD